MKLLEKMARVNRNTAKNLKYMIVFISLTLLYSHYIILLMLMSLRLFSKKKKKKVENSENEGNFCECPKIEIQPNCVLEGA